RCQPVWDRRPGLLRDLGDGHVDLALEADRDREAGPVAGAGVHHLLAVEAGVCPHQQRPLRARPACPGQGLGNEAGPASAACGASTPPPALPHLPPPRSPPQPPPRLTPPSPP